jgi:hypothetical protein
MEQRCEGRPRADIRLEGRRVTRGDVQNDWGLLLRWEIRRNGYVVGTPPARVQTSYEVTDLTPGTYTIVLQQWKYVDYRKTPDGEFINSRFIDISNKVSFTV